MKVVELRVILPADFVLRKQGGVTIQVDRKIADRAFLAALDNLDVLFASSQCQIVKDQRKIKVARLRFKMAGEERALYVKRYNSFSLRFKLLSPFVQSGAFRSLRGAEILRRAGIATVKPVAAVEKRKYGILLNSFFISDEIVGGKTADAYWRENLQSRRGSAGIRLRRQFIRLLGDLFRSLHAEGIYHDDLKDANILAVGREDDAKCELLLLDMEGVRRCNSLSDKRRIKNLVQLYRTLGRYFSKTQSLLFLKVYLGSAFHDRKRERVGSVLRRARYVDRLKGQSAQGAMF